MPDTTPTQSLTPGSTTTEAPPSEDGWRPDLSALRARLDELDDTIHDLLMERARVVENVARSGKTATFRPGREASILRRLLARHSGKLPARTLVRMWREMLAGTTAMQTAVTVAVFDPTPGRATTAIAREHFGFLTPAIAHPSAEAALGALRAGTVTVAVLPFPIIWWPALTAMEPRLHIIARLPFWTDRPPHVPTADALVVGTTAPDASGSDRSFIASQGIVSEIPFMATDDDPRLPPGAIVLGGYAVPVPGEPT
jgi:chorismate mutase/prephenate dehydratase